MTDRTALLPRPSPGLEPVHPGVPDAWTDVDLRDRDAGRALGTLAWIVPTLLMAVLAVTRASWPGLWGDELATWGMVTTPWPDLAEVLRNFDAAIGPYYVLMKGVTAVLGTSEFALRLPSMIAMVAAAGLVSSLGTRLATPRVGLISGVLFAAIPTTSRYAQEARPYAIALLAAVLSTYFLVRILDRARFFQLIGYAAAVALLGLSHFLALLLLLAHAFVVLTMRRRRFALWLCATLMGVLPALPVVFLAQAQKDQVSWIPEAELSRVVSLPEALFGVELVGGALVVLTLMGISFKRPAVVYTAWAVLPAIGLYVAAQLTPVWLPRYLLFTLPAYALLAATVLGRAPVLRGIVVVAALAAAGVPAQLEVREPDGHSQATREIGRVIETNALPGDIIVYGSSGADQRVSRDAVARYVRADRRPKDVLMIKPARTDGSFTARECPDVARCFGRPDRVWIVRNGRWQDPLGKLGAAKESLLRGNYVVDERFQPTGLTIALLVRQTSDTDRPPPR